jgi:large subunit ribosomal protein L2
MIPLRLSQYRCFTTLALKPSFSEEYTVPPLGRPSRKSHRPLSFSSKPEWLHRPIRSYVKRATPSQRQWSWLDRSTYCGSNWPTKLVSTGRLKHATRGQAKTGGRNHYGQLTAWHKGGGHKKVHRIRAKPVPFRSYAQQLVYRPGTTGPLTVATACHGPVTYRNTTRERLVGTPIITLAQPTSNRRPTPLRYGHRYCLEDLPAHAQVSSISSRPYGKPAYVLRAGTYATVRRQGDKRCTLVLPSGKRKAFLSQCTRLLGKTGRENTQYVAVGKAGRSRWMGRRPTVRGVAINPVDHPMGGGAGKTSGGRPSVTPWGKPTKGGYRTRRIKKVY